MAVAPATHTAARTKAAPSATPVESAPEAMGRSRLMGCCASASRSRTSLTRYTAPESPQKIRNAASAGGQAARSRRCPLKSRPANTNRFFVHCCGRRDLTSSTTGAEVELLGDGEAADGVGLVVVALENGEELGDGQQVLDALGEVQQAHVAALPLHRRVRAHHLAQPGAVDVGNVGQVQNELLAALEHEAVDLVLQDLVALAERHLALEVQNGDVAGGSFLDLHRSSESFGMLWKAQNSSIRHRRVRFWPET